MSGTKLNPAALAGITCPACRRRLEALAVDQDGWPIVSPVYAVGNAARDELGHAMYHTAEGRTALCAASRRPE